MAMRRFRTGRHASRRVQPLRYTHTRAGGKFIQMRSDASVSTRESPRGIGGVVIE